MGRGRKHFVAANWKQSASKPEIHEMIRFLSSGVNRNTEVVVACPQAHLQWCAEHMCPGVSVAAQNCYAPEGKHGISGEVTPAQIQEWGVDWVVLGQQERRRIICEPDWWSYKRLGMAMDHGLKVIWCYGENLEERGKGWDWVDKANWKWLEGALPYIKDYSRFVLAYEPAWSPYTEYSESPDQAQYAMARVRKWLAEHASPYAASTVRMIYGGNVHPGNCHELGQQPDIDGFWVGDACYNPGFLKIINAWSTW